MNISRRKFLVGCTASTIAMLTGIGCSNDNNEINEISKKDILRLQSPWVNDAEFLGYFIAIEKKYYENMGVNFKYLPGGPDIIADSVLISNGCEVALTNIDGTMKAILEENAPLKIIGAQYQKSPLGVVSLKENDINEPIDLKGKTLAVPSANEITTKAFLRINGIDPDEVKFMPYQYDPTILTDGVVDATVDFVTNVPYSIRLRGFEPSSFLFYDYKFKMFMDTVVVSEKTLSSRKNDLIDFLKASQMGWEENFKDTSKYPKQFINSYFKGTGRSADNEIYFNEEQKDLILNEHGVYFMSEEAINDNIQALTSIGLPATKDMFVNIISS